MLKWILFAMATMAGDPAFLPVGTSNADGAGCFSAWTEFPNQPVVVMGGSEAFVYRRRFSILVPRGEVTRVWSFIGTSAGDHFEADMEIETREGIRLYQRSPHHRAASYDAWAPMDVSYTCLDQAGCRADVILLGRVTDVNSSPQNPNFGLLRADFHFGLRLQLCPVPRIVLRRGSR